MSKYTTEVRFLCESLTGLTESKGFNDVDTIINNAVPIIFNFDFPLYDSDYKDTLCAKILRHYYTREISEETYGLWKLRLQDRLNIIMPYYNQLYASTLLMMGVNPLHDVDLQTEHSGENIGSTSSEIEEKATTTGNREGENNNVKSNENNKTNEHTGSVDDNRNKSEFNVNNGEENEIKTGNNENDRKVEYRTEGNEINNGERKNNTNETEGTNSHGESTEWTLFSDTPQGGINGIEGFTDEVGNNTYLTTATKNTNTNSNDSTTNTDNNSVEIASNVNINTENSNTDENNVSKSNDDRINSKINIEEKTYEDSNKRIYDERNNEYVNENEINNANFNESSDESKTGNKSENRTSFSTDEYLQRIVGKSGGNSYSALLLEYRETFINIDEMIIEELSDLFFGLW